MLKIGSHFRDLRAVRGYTQEEVATALGMSRATYIQLEKGMRDLTISEMHQAARFFNVSELDIINHRLPQEASIVVRGRTQSPTLVPALRVSVPQENVDKFTEVLLYILDRVGAKPNIGMTALYKLLYFIDFDYYEKYETQLIGATYIKNHYGPTPIEFAKIIRAMEARGELETVKSQYFNHEQTKYLPHRKPDLSKLNARELKLIDDVLARLSDKSARELSDYSHQDVPWKSHELGEKIDYETVFYRDKDHSVRDLDNDEL